MKSTYCFNKKPYEDKTETTFAILYLKYRLLGLARLDISGLSIYTHFFSPFKARQGHSSRKISCFFAIFVKIFFFKHFLGRAPNISTAHEITKIIDEQMFKGQTEGEWAHGLKLGEWKQLYQFTKESGKNFLQEYSPLLGQGNLSLGQIQIAFPKFASDINQEIRKLLETFYTEVSASELLEEEVSEQFKKDMNFYKKWVIQSFEAVNNIDILKKQRRRYLLRELAIANSAQGFNIPNMDFNTRKKVQQVNFRHFTKEYFPIIISFADFFNHRQGPSQNDVKTVYVQLVRDFIQICCKYQENTGSYLPRLTAEDIYFNQRSLKVGFIYDKLIMETLGLLHPEARSFEARMAFEPTPVSNENDCWLESVPENQIQLKKKLYFNLNEKDGSKKLEEKILCWRMLDIAFFTFNKTHLAQYYYRKRFPKMPFKKQKLNETKKDVYDQIALGEISVAGIIKNTQKQLLGEQKVPFDFTLGRLKEIAGIKEKEDSLLQAMQFEKRFCELRERAALFKETFNFLTDENFFQNMLSAKKCIILLLLSYLQQVNYQSISHDRLESKMESGYISLQNEKREKQMTIFIDKLKDYEGRINNENAKYLRQNSRQMRQINSITYKFSSICALGKDLSKLEEDFRLQEYQGDKQVKQNPQSEYKQKKQELKKEYDEVVKDIKKFLKEYMEKQVSCYQKRAYQLHKKGTINEGWSDFCLYLNRKLPLLIQAQLYLNSSNLMRFSTLCRPMLMIDLSKKLSDQFALSRQKGEIDIWNAKLKMAEKWFKEEKEILGT